jgi:hypothetical protein
MDEAKDAAEARVQALGRLANDRAKEIAENEHQIDVLEREVARLNDLLHVPR